MKKLNNKGFSLVELIIVIAIMAILIGVVGAQLIPYLETSRQAKDQQILSSYNTSAMTAYSRAAAQIDATVDYTITIEPAGVVTVGPSTAPGIAQIKTMFMELEPNAGQFGDFESKDGKAITKVVITIKHTGGQVLQTTSPAGAFVDIESK